MQNKSAKLKICHLSSVHFAMDTRIFYRMCVGLSKKYDVSLIACHGKNEVLKGVNIINFPRYHKRIFRMLFSWLIMLPKALKQKAKLYHLHDPELIPCGLILRLLGKKVIIDIHENIADDIFDKDWIPFKKLAYYTLTFFERIAAKTCYLLLAEDSYKKRYDKMGKNISVIHNYCDLDFFKAYRKEALGDLHHLYYIGILLENRAILQIIEAIYILKQKGETFTFHCVGELYTDLHGKIIALPYWDEIKEQIIFYGRKNLDQGYEISKKAGIGLAIIHPMRNSMESYPTKIFEYMAIGMPVICSNFDLYKSVVDKNEVGMSVNPLSSKDIANTILKLVADKNLLKNSFKKSLLIVKNQYNWAAEELELLRIYYKLLN